MGSKHTEYLRDLGLTNWSEMKGDYFVSLLTSLEVNSFLRHLLYRTKIALSIKSSQIKLGLFQPLIYSTMPIK